MHTHPVESRVIIWSWSPGAALWLPTAPQGRVKCRDQVSLYAVFVTNNVPLEQEHMLSKMTTTGRKIPSDGLNTEPSVNTEHTEPVPMLIMRMSQTNSLWWCRAEDRLSAWKLCQRHSDNSFQMTENFGSSSPQSAALNRMSAFITLNVLVLKEARKTRQLAGCLRDCHL